MAETVRDQAEVRYNAVEEQAIAEHMQDRLQFGRFYSMEASAAAVPSLRHAQSSAFVARARPAALQLSLDIDVDDGDALARSAFGDDADASVAAAVVAAPAQDAASPADGSQPEAMPAALPPVFFRVACSRPSRHKRVPLPAAQARRLGKGDMCVTLHSAQLVDGRWVACLEPLRAEGISSPIAVISACRADVASLKSELTSWSARKDVLYTIADLDEASQGCVRAVLQELVQSRAMADSSVASHFVVVNGSPLSEPHLEGLRILAARLITITIDIIISNIVIAITNTSAITNTVTFTSIIITRRLVECSGSSARQSEWVLSESGMQQLRTARVLVAPSPVFVVPTDRAALADCTTWEMLMLMNSEGWTLRRKPSKEALLRRPLAPLRNSDDDTKFWYLSGVSLRKSRVYMRVLLQSAELFGAGRVKEIHHLQPLKYYDKLLQGKSTGEVEAPALADAPPVPQLRLDVEEEEDVPALADQLPSESRPAIAVAVADAAAQAIIVTCNLIELTLKPSC